MRIFTYRWAPALLVTLVACSDSDSPDDTSTTMSAQPGDSGSDTGDTTDPNGDSDGAMMEAEDPGDDGSVDDDGAGMEGSSPTELTPTEAPDSQSGGNGNPSDEPAEDPNQAEDPEPEPQPAAAVCPEGPFADDPLEGAGQPVEVCTQLSFTEGAVWFAERETLYFSDMVFQANGNQGTIQSYSPGGNCETFVNNAGTNGLVLGPDGNLLAARHGDQTLTSFDLETAAPTVFLADNGEAPFNAPNDITILSDGNIYFTDPNYGLVQGANSSAPTGAYWRNVDGQLTQFSVGGNPNGITLSPNESRLYMSHLEFTGGSDIVVFDLAEDGTPSAPSPFANFGSDGMGMDCAGNLYTTGGGQVQILNPSGENIGSINAPGAANVAFGGPERRTLYITAGTTLLELELAIPGMPY